MSQFPQQPYPPQAPAAYPPQAAPVQPYPPQAPAAYPPQAPAAYPPQAPAAYPPQAPAAYPAPAPAPVAGAIPQGIFGGVETAVMTFNAEYIKPGKYWIKITCCKIAENQKREAFAAIEGAVVKVIDNAFSTGNRLGADTTDYIPRSSRYFLSDIKSFCAALLGVDPQTLIESQCMDIFGPLQPFTASCSVGEVEAKQIITKDGKPFTKIMWKRTVPAAELLLTLPPDIRERHFPNGILLQMANHNQQFGGAPVPIESEWGSLAAPEPPVSAPVAVPPPAAPPPAAPLPLGYAPAPQMAPQAPAPPQAQYAPAPAPHPGIPPQAPAPISQPQYRPAPPAPAPMPQIVAPPPAPQPGAAPAFVPPQAPATAPWGG